MRPPAAAPQPADAAKQPGAVDETLPDPADAAGEAAPDAQPRRLLQPAAAAPDIGTAPDLSARVDARVTQPPPANPAELPAAADPEQTDYPGGALGGTAGAGGAG